MHQPWRTFAAIINRCISGKSTGLDRLRPSRAQILWGMFYQKNVDYVALLWEDIMFQADNRDISTSRKENMPYPRFTKVTISHFISKVKTIYIRNRTNHYTIRDDSLLGTLKFVFKTQDYQKYGALILEEMINQDIKDSKAYKRYLTFATRQATPKKARKFKKIASPSKKLSLVLEEEAPKKPKRAKKPAKKSTTVPTAGVVIKDTPVGSQPKVPDEYEDKTTGTDKGTGTKPGVPDVPKYQSESENESCGDSDDDSNDDDDDVDSDAYGDNEASDIENTDSDNEENPNLNQNDNEEEDMKK
ncbi:hypothetical protein Tco_0438512, partial [Tanacetum coccineum]